MTRKDYELIADALAAERPEHDGLEYEQWCRDVNGLATALLHDGGYDLNGNRRFKTDLFNKRVYGLMY